MDNLIDRRGYRSHFLHQIVTTPEKLQNKKQGFSQFYSLALYCEKLQKMAKFMRTGKPLPPNFFFVNSYDL